MKKGCLGVIIGNRGFFPDALAKEGREVLPRVLEELGYKVIVLDKTVTKHGAVEDRGSAKKCAELFQAHRGEIDGIVSGLPNFGEEVPNADAIQMSGLNVPVLVVAFPDDLKKMGIDRRRDSLCGGFSACRNLRRRNIPYTVTGRSVLDPESNEFAVEMRRFGAVCRIVRGIRNCRVGIVGPRPNAFATMCFSENTLSSRLGVQVTTTELLTIVEQAKKLGEPEIKGDLEKVQSYVPCKQIPEDALNRMARLLHELRRFKEENELDALALQCWTALENHYGIVPCGVMSMLTEELCCSACEVDVLGVLSMRALMLASGEPSLLADWNNNGATVNRFNAFHCSNWPKSAIVEPVMDVQEIIAGSVGRENACGTINGVLRANANVTLCRLSEDPLNGQLFVYEADGKTVPSEIDTFGGFGEIEVPKLQTLIRFGKENGVEHHVAVGFGHWSDAIHEAFVRYLGVDSYWHNRPEEDEE